MGMSVPKAVRHVSDASAVLSRSCNPDVHVLWAVAVAEARHRHVMRWHGNVYRSVGGGYAVDMLHDRVSWPDPGTGAVLWCILDGAVKHVSTPCAFRAS